MLSIDLRGNSEDFLIESAGRNPSSLEKVRTKLRTFIIDFFQYQVDNGIRTKQEVQTLLKLLLPNPVITSEEQKKLLDHTPIELEKSNDYLFTYNTNRLNYEDPRTSIEDLAQSFVSLWDEKIRTWINGLGGMYALYSDLNYTEPVIENLLNFLEENNIDEKLVNLITDMVVEDISCLAYTNSEMHISPEILNFIDNNISESFADSLKDFLTEQYQQLAYEISPLSTKRPLLEVINVQDPNLNRLKIYRILKKEIKNLYIAQVTETYESTKNEKKLKFLLKVINQQFI